MRRPAIVSVLGGPTVVVPTTGTTPGAPASGTVPVFLPRVLSMALLILILAVVDIGFPFVPRQNALVTLLTVGLPTLALAAWARPREPRQQSSRSVFQFVVPAAGTRDVPGSAAPGGR